MKEQLIFYDESAVKWVDKICIPAASERFETVRPFMDYFLDEVVGADLRCRVYLR